MRRQLRYVSMPLTMLFATGPAVAADVQHKDVIGAVETCVRATTRSGVDDRPFVAAAWTREDVTGLPGDRFYAKKDLRASLGTRPGVGGSCIISFNVRSSYDLLPLTDAVATSLHAERLASSPTSGLLLLDGKLLQTRVDPTPVGSMVSVAVDMTG